MQKPEPAHRESGHLLITLMIALTVMSILLGAAFQQWSVIIHREKEEELIFRGGQYVDAIIRYRLDHGGALPTSLEALAEPGPRGFRYIRKLFPDPFEVRPPGEEEDDWLGLQEEPNSEAGWGLLYLGPQGKWIYDPQAAKRAAENAGHTGDDIPDQFQNSGMTSTSVGLQGLAGGLPGAPGTLGLSPPGGPPGGVGLPGQGLPGVPGGLAPGAQGALAAPGGNLPLGGPQVFSGTGIPAAGVALGQQIVGVVSRSGERGFRRYQQKEKYWDWQFHIFTVLRVPTQQQGAGGARTPAGRGLGPGGKFLPPGTSLPPPKNYGQRPQKPDDD